MNQTELDTIRKRVETAYLQILETRILLMKLESEMSDAKLWLVGKRVSFTWLDPKEVMTGVVVTPTAVCSMDVFVEVTRAEGAFMLRVAD